MPRIAVLLPQPEESRAELESVFRAILAPELQPIEADNSATPWEFTSGCAAACTTDDFGRVGDPAPGAGSAVYRTPWEHFFVHHLLVSARSILQRLVLMPMFFGADRICCRNLTWMGLLVSFGDSPGRPRLQLLSRAWLKAFDDVCAARLRTLLRAATPNGRRSSAIYCAQPTGPAIERRHLLSSRRPGHGTRTLIFLRRWTSAARV